MPEGPESLPEGPEGLPGGWVGMDGPMDKQTEFLLILQDFVPCRGRCPKRQKKRFQIMLSQENNTRVLDLSPLGLKANKKKRNAMRFYVKLVMRLKPS